MDNIKTKEQQEYYDSFLPKKYKKKEKELMKIMSRTEYMNNCIFWLNEYYQKRCTKERVVLAARHLKIYCEEIIQELKS